MKNILLSLIAFSAIALPQAYSQTTKLDINKLQPVSVSMSAEKILGKNTIRVIKDPAVKEFDEPTFAKLRNVNFKMERLKSKY